ncbi:MAG: hypothetical protein GAK37_02473 [Pseudomonas sp.]|nr:MAG: hypothetical protein GAK37_02473 [Pseudomonas sp.]
MPDPLMPPLQHWSHPFKDSRHSLSQLTHLANATGGYYALGRNGLWPSIWSPTSETKHHFFKPAAVSPSPNVRTRE